jgi:hypothetical protein
MRGEIDHFETIQRQSGCGHVYFPSGFALEAV